MTSSNSPRTGSRSPSNESHLTAFGHPLNPFSKSLMAIEQRDKVGFVMPALGSYNLDKGALVFPWPTMDGAEGENKWTPPFPCLPLVGGRIIE